MTDTTQIEAALRADQTIDIVTTGARSGQPRRIEIWYHCIDGRYFITGIPGEAHNPSRRRPRDWLANLRQHPQFEFHLKESVQLGLLATAQPVNDPHLRRRVLTAPQTQWYREQGHELQDLIDNAPLVEVCFPAGYPRV
jgi:hypothetical protein